MKTIVVSGSHSGMGKTTLAEKILRGKSNWSALKVTVVNKSPCPHQTDCHICEEVKRDFEIVTDRVIINQRGTDTSRLKNAGAKKVVWLKAKPGGLKRGLENALAEVKDSAGVVIEGTSVLKYITPDLTIYLKDKNNALIFFSLLF